MQYLIAIFQSVAQAFTYIFPISQTGHSAIFHDFASRYSGTCSQVTGLINIGISIGIIIAFYKVFIKLIFEFISTFKDLINKQFKLQGSTNSRAFFYYTLIPYVLMILYLIPCGKEKNIYKLLHSYSHDKNIFIEGLCFAIIGGLLYFTFLKLKNTKSEKGNQLSIIPVVVTSLVLFISIPVAGLSISATILSILLLFGVNKKISFRYFISISAPLLLVIGIIQSIIGVTHLNIVASILAIVISTAASYVFIKLFLQVIKKNYFLYFSIYDLSIGIISIIIGIVQIITK